MLQSPSDTSLPRAQTREGLELDRHTQVRALAGGASIAVSVVLIIGALLAIGVIALIVHLIASFNMKGFG